MRIQAIKRYIPSKLLGRTILIFLFPIVFIEIVVFIAFVQKHFEQVTDQMSESLAYEIHFIQSQLNKPDSKQRKVRTIEDLGSQFGLSIKMNASEPKIRIVGLEYFDFSGKAFVEKMEKTFGENLYFNFSDRRQIQLIFPVKNQFLLIGFPKRRISAANPHQLLVLMFFVSVLLVTFSLIVLKNQIKPIVRLAEVSDAFGKGQSLPFKPAGSDEVRKAGLAFLAMRSRIEKQIDQRSQMLSGVSHDLRTPLTRLKLSLSMSKPSKEIKKMLQDVDSMQVMLDELLTFAKTDSLEETINIDPISLIKNIIKENQLSYNNIEFEIDSNYDKKFKISIRKSSFRRAIQNLIDNALNHSTKILIRIKLDNKFVTFFIEDNGPGIPKNERVNALKPFTRLDQSRNQNTHSGVGLGLAITLDTVKSHGGSLFLETSKTLGGLKVKISLPI